MNRNFAACHARAFLATVLAVSPLLTSIASAEPAFRVVAPVPAIDEPAVARVLPALPSLPAAVPSAVTGVQADAASEDYIVVLKEGVDPDDVASAHKASVQKTFSTALNGFAGSVNPALVQKLRDDPRVALVEPDYTVTAYAQTLPTGVNRIEAEKNPIRIDVVLAKVDIDVAVIDTGIDLDHPDLTVHRNVNFVTATKNGDDDNGHGSHVAGTIGAKDNRIGAIGVAPGARLWAVKVLDRNGSGKMSSIIAGVDYVVQNASEIEVANMSLGCTCVSQALNDAINRAIAKGVVFTVAAGNEAKNADTFSPANHPSVITVSAMADFDGKAGALGRATCRIDKDDTFADFSNYGSVVDIAAPGVCIYSTWKNGMYSTISGTSMAAPHVAGAAALYAASHGRSLDAAGVEAIKTAILSAAAAQDVAAGFSGDPDTYKEPLLQAQSL